LIEGAQPTRPSARMAGIMLRMKSLLGFRTI
jgi:hypothetical protein